MNHKLIIFIMSFLCGGYALVAWSGLSNGNSSEAESISDMTAAQQNNNVSDVENKSTEDPPPYEFDESDSNKKTGNQVQLPDSSGIRDFYYSQSQYFIDSQEEKTGTGRNMENIWSDLLTAVVSDSNLEPEQKQSFVNDFSATFSKYLDIAHRNNAKALDATKRTENENYKDRDKSNSGSSSDKTGKQSEIPKISGIKDAVTDIRLAELDLRMQIMETVNYEGVLHWKMKDYKRRKLEGIDGKTLSLYSQPFYTSRAGYKMCGRVYLNGDGMGKGTHISFFFVVMKGDYDNCLAWPFSEKITFTLLDQKDGSRHLSDSFIPDKENNSVAKPTSEMNVALGVPFFASHSILESERYLQDDTIILVIEVGNSKSPLKQVRKQDQKQHELLVQPPVIDSSLVLKPGNAISPAGKKHERKYKEECLIL
ncbi:hypothetical protein CI610_01082 [invertebrate metagenome]|uniref:MATH domain-containing protein n=1 Tax=invertebrate metagenome TaxID=1711999 RepID=A0A2H9T9Q0_9ZZZZ